MVESIALPPIWLAKLVEKVVPLVAELLSVQEEINGTRPALAIAPEPEHLQPSFASGARAFNGSIDLQQLVQAPHAFGPIVDHVPGTRP